MSDRLNELSQLNELLHSMLSRLNIDNNTFNNVGDAIDDMVFRLKHSYWRKCDLSNIFEQLNTRGFTALMIIIEHPVRSFLEKYYPNEVGQFNKIFETPEFENMKQKIKMNKEYVDQYTKNMITKTGNILKESQKRISKSQIKSYQNFAKENIIRWRDPYKYYSSKWKAEQKVNELKNVILK